MRDWYLIYRSTDKHLGVILEQERDRLMLLKKRWTNPVPKVPGPSDSYDIFVMELELPSDYRVDTKLLRRLSAIDEIADCHQKNQQRRIPARALSYFTEPDIKWLETPGKMLDDACINGGALILQYVFTNLATTSSNPVNKITMLTSYDFPHIKHGASDDEIWRVANRSEYWDKGIWILPIHRAEQHHWILCAINVCNNEILTYDSLAGS
jgi:hypothetical protein